MKIEKTNLFHKSILFLIVLTAICSMLYWGNQKEGYHVDELYSYGLANSEYLPFMHFGTHDYMVKDWMKEYGPGNEFPDLFKNLIHDVNVLKSANFNIKSSSLYQDYLYAQQNSANTHSTTWVAGQDYLHYLTASPENRFNIASVYYNQRGDVHPPLFYLLLHFDVSCDRILWI